MPPYKFLKNLAGVVIEVTLNVDDGGTLITGAGGQVAQRTDQVSQAAGGSTLRCHAASQITLCTDSLLDCCLQLFAAEVCVIVVSQILQLQLVGSAFQTGGMGNGNAGVSQLPNFAHLPLHRGGFGAVRNC